MTNPVSSTHRRLPIRPHIPPPRPHHSRHLPQHLRMPHHIRTLSRPKAKLINNMSYPPLNPVPIPNTPAPKHLHTPRNPRLMPAPHDREQNQRRAHQTAHVVPQAVVAVAQGAHVEDFQVAVYA